MAPLVVQRLMHEPVPVPCSFSQVATSLSATNMFMHCLFHVAHAYEPVHCKSSPQYADYNWIAIPEFLVQEHQGESYIKMRATSQPIIKLVAGSRLQDFQECIHEFVR